MSATHRPPTSNATPHFVEVVAATVERFGHRPLLSAHGSGAALTYADVWGWAGASAQRLAGVGATPGERVVVRAPKSVEMLIAYLAALRLGAVWTPVAPTATTTELNQVIDDAEPRVVIDGNRALCDMVGAAPAGAPEPQPGDWPNPTPGPDQIAAMLYTSGTTGRPKGVPITGAALSANAHALVDAWRFTEHDVLVHALPIHHAHGLFVAVGCVLASGSSMRWIDRFDATEVIDGLRKATMFMGVPTHFVRLLEDSGFDRATCASVRLLISGSAPLPAVTFQHIADRTGLEVVERYGMTETLMLASNPIDGIRKPGSVGLPLPGVEVRLGSFDDADRPGRATEVGMVEVRGPSVFEHYWGRPPDPADRASAADDDHAEGPAQQPWFRTGDLGRFDADGYLHLVGRSKDLIISGGLNVYPAEVEAVLEGQPGVAEVAVIGQPDDHWGQQVTAIVVPDTGPAPSDEFCEQLVASARERLSAYKLPRQVHLTDALPRNTMGKVDKAALRRSFG